MSAAPDRAAELAARLAQVRERIAAACDSAGRRREDVTLVAVTKFFPAADAATLVRLGVAHLGESRDQEAAAKVDDVAALLDGVRPAWHFVGQVQTNKAGRIARYADVVQSVDRDRLVDALAGGAQRAGRTLDLLVQVGLGGPDADRRGGAEPSEVPRLAERIARAEGVRLRGVMAVAPRGVDPAAAFTELADVAGRVRADHPEAVVLSAGMSGDLEQAVAAGATHLRIGSAILGGRPPAG